MLDICIVSYDTPEEILEKTLDGIVNLNPNCKYDYTINIVECGSSAHSFYIANRYKAWYTLSPENLHYVKGNQHIINYTSNKYILLLSPDCWPIEEDWITRLIADYENSENCGVLGAVLKFKDGRIQHSGATNFNNYSDWPQDKGQFNTVRNVPWVIGALQLIRRDLIEELGINPTNYHVPQDGWPDVGTDRELCYHLRELGYEIYCSPIRFIHPAKVEEAQNT